MIVSTPAATRRRGRLTLVEITWLVASLTLVLWGARSLVRAWYLEPWESWLQLPWYQKAQPVQLSLRRYLQEPPALDAGTVPRATPADLESSARAAADWLVGDQEASGHFRYWYDPVADAFSPPGDDSFHRQAGAAYGLVLAYEMFGDQRYLVSARKGVEYLFRFKRTLEPDKTYFLAEDQADLGGAALPMLVMLRLRELTGTTVYDPELRRLANFLLFLQRQYGTGAFKSTYVYRGAFDIEKQRSWESPISPGQAMLALAWMHRNFGDPIYKDSIDRALKVYSDERYWKQAPFLPWTLDALASLYSSTGDTVYAGQATTLADYLVSWQNLDGRDGVLGSFGSFPSAFSASYLEGLGSALQVVQQTGDSARDALYRRRAEVGYLWLTSLQYRKNGPASVQSNERTIGGFARSPNDPRIRIDQNQHAISALVGGLRHVFGQQPAVRPLASRR
jgi:hypothetical protein